MKKLFWMLGSLIVVALLLIVLVPYFIGSEAFKTEIEQQLEKATGHNVRIAGKIQLRIFPFAGATLEDVTISGFSQKNDAPLVKLKALHADVALLPLIRQKVEIKSLLFKEPDINLQINQQGKNNWEIAPKNSKEVDESSSDNNAVSVAPANFILNNLKISGGSVSYQDARAGDHWKVDKLDLSVKADSATSPLSLKISASWNDKPIEADVDLQSLDAILGNDGGNVSAEIKGDLLAISAKGIIKNNVYSGPIGIKSSSLKSLMAWVKPKEKPLAVNAPLALNINGNANCSKVSCELSDVSFTLDNLNAKGKVKTILNKDVPYVEMDFSTDRLDLTPFLSNGQKQVSASWFFSNAVASEAWNSDPIDLTLLRQIDAMINVRTNALIVNKIHIDKTLFRAKIQKGQLFSEVTDAQFYKGTANITLNVNASGAEPILEKRVLMKDVDMEAFLKDASNSARLSGTGEFQIVVNSHGKSQRDLVSSAAGNGYFRITDGAMKGFNIADMVRNIQSAYKEVDQSSQKTDFTELGGTFTISNGIISNNDLNMKSPLTRLSGKGQINLLQYTINYRLSPQVVDTLKGQGGKDKEGLGVPVLVEGSLDNPHFRPDLQSVVEEAINDPQKLKEQVKEGKSAIKNLLKGFKKP